MWREIRSVYGWRSVEHTAKPHVCHFCGMDIPKGSRADGFMVAGLLHLEDIGNNVRPFASPEYVCEHCIPFADSWTAWEEHWPDDRTGFFDYLRELATEWPETGARMHPLMVAYARESVEMDGEWPWETVVDHGRNARAGRHTWTT